MEKSRTIFIWDIQWCFDELKLLIKKLNLKPNDKVYFVWDLINKWPKSYKVLKYMYKNKHRFYSVKWNHELNFLRWLKWETYNNDKDFKNLKKKIEKNKTHYLIKYIEELPLYIEKKDFLLIHWGLIPNKIVTELTEDEITRTRDIKWKPWYKYYTWNKKIIYWHWAEDSLQINKKTKWLDSWCVYWKALTAYILETEEVIQQNALDVYINVYKKNWWIIKRIFN
jgi:bis(5'-nucleosyl)-tetraphosphatase (symmetrical)